VNIYACLLKPDEACPISNKQFNSLDFALKGCFRKIFRTRSVEVVQNCMFIFNCMSLQECIAKRKCKFLANYVKSDNILCYFCQNTAAHELNMLGKRKTVTISFSSLK